MTDSLFTATYSLAAFPAWGLGLLTAFFIFVCVVMILTVLIQRPQGGGLSGAFGSGAGSGQTAFGARTGDALTWATIVMFAFFVITAVVLNFAARPSAATASPEGDAGAGEVVVEEPETEPVGETEPTEPETDAEGGADEPGDDNGTVEGE